MSELREVLAEARQKNKELEAAAATAAAAAAPLAPKNGLLPPVEGAKARVDP